MQTAYRYDIIRLESKDEIFDMLLKMVSAMLAEDSLERIIRKKLEDKQE